MQSLIQPINGSVVVTNFSGDVPEIPATEHVIVDSASLLTTPPETWAIDWTAGTITQGPIPTPVPHVISDRQFFQQLAVQGVITQDDALAAVRVGTLPPALVQLVSALPPDQQFGANMLLCGATQFERSHPMVAVLGQAFGWTDAQLDTLWTEAAAL